MIPTQIGFPRLGEARSQVHFDVLREWLKTCDEHSQRFKCQPTSTNFKPTRLVYLVPDDPEMVQLYETRTEDDIKYLALSHPWGENPPYFCTFQRNLQQHKNGIKVSSLPSTFRDAVRITRELGFEYIWIDSICIIQRDHLDAGDFEQEAARMENVFSSAWCVLAASSGKGQSGGFLKMRDGSSREFVTFRGPGQVPFYVCAFLDDFKSHVLEGRLNKRGWVLQERLLAHRTIYFTDKQTYWQCGEGVRCETLTRMNK
jgi:hypothetical protein